MSSLFNGHVGKQGLAQGQQGEDDAAGLHYRAFGGGGDVFDGACLGGFELHQAFAVGGLGQAGA